MDGNKAGTMGIIAFFLYIILFFSVLIIKLKSSLRLSITLLPCLCVSCRLMVAYLVTGWKDSHKKKKKGKAHGRPVERNQ